MRCIDCKYLNRIANTDETGQAICGYPMSFFPVCIYDECAFTPKPYTCGDCQHFAENDWACMTAEAEDSIYKDGSKCWGFEDRKESEFFAILADWKLRGYDISKKIDSVLTNFNEEFKSPFDD